MRPLFELLASSNAGAKLHVLKLEFNALCDQALVEFSKAFLRRQILADANLSYNLVSDTGVYALLKNLSIYPVMANAKKFLALYGHGLSDDCKRRLKQHSTSITVAVD